MAKSILWAALPHFLRSDPRAISLSDHAFRALVEAVLWSSENKTDGALTKGYVGRVMSQDNAAELREAGLLDDHDMIGFFLAVNRSKAEREAAENAGAVGAAARWNANRNANRNAGGSAKYRVQRSEEKNTEQSEHPSGVIPIASQSGTQLEIVEQTPDKPKERKPRTPKGAHPNYKAALDVIDRVYKEATGSKPDWSSPKENRTADRLCRAWDLAEIEKRARRFWIQKLPMKAWSNTIATLSVSDFGFWFANLHVNEAVNDGLSWFQRNPGWENANGTH